MTKEAPPRLKHFDQSRLGSTQYGSIFRCQLDRKSHHERISSVPDRAKVNVAVEAGIRQGWDAIIGSDGDFVGMTSFGASAPYQELYKHFGITAEKVAEAALGRLSGRTR